MENTNSYFECKRCFYNCDKKSNMVKHLNKKKLCIRAFESYGYKDEDLYDLSLQRIKHNIKKFTCTSCNKNFYNNNNLKRHIEKSCKKKLDESLNTTTVLLEELNIPIEASEIIDSNTESIHIGNNNNINSNNVNNINNNINININITKSFDEEWDLSQIDIHKKIILLLNNSKFTSTLENILENEVNLNVLIDNTSDNGIVFTNNKLINMNIKDIIKKTMDKLHKHLNNFHNDIINPNILNLKPDIFNNELKIMNNKYNDFNKSKDTQNIVKEYITDIYNKKKQNTVNFIEKNGY